MLDKVFGQVITLPSQDINDSTWEVRCLKNLKGNIQTVQL